MKVTYMKRIPIGKQNQHIQVKINKGKFIIMCKKGRSHTWGESPSSWPSFSFNLIIILCHNHLHCMKLFVVQIIGWISPTVQVHGAPGSQSLTHMPQSDLLLEQNGNAHYLILWKDCLVNAHCLIIWMDGLSS